MQKLFTELGSLWIALFQQRFQDDGILQSFDDRNNFTLPGVLKQQSEHVNLKIIQTKLKHHFHM